MREKRRIIRRFLLAMSEIVFFVTQFLIVICLKLSIYKGKLIIVSRKLYVCNLKSPLTTAGKSVRHGFR